jgi:hypothetical protein
MNVRARIHNMQPREDVKLNINTRAKLNHVFCCQVVDAKHIIQHLDEEKPEGVENESVEQLAFADKVLLNKVCAVRYLFPCPLRFLTLHGESTRVPVFSTFHSMCGFDVLALRCSEASVPSAT